LSPYRPIKTNHSITQGYNNVVGAVAQAILKKGGQEIITELNKQSK